MKRHTIARCAAFLGAMALLPALPLAMQARLPAAPALFPKQTSLSLRTSGAAAFPDAAALFSAPSAEESAAEAEKSLPESSVSLALPSAYLVLDTGSGEVLSLSPFDYVCGVTAAEIPITFHPEAVKAQAVAAHSYALRQMGLQLQNPDPALKGAYLSTDPAHFQAYLSRGEREALWGEQFAENEEKLENAVSAVLGSILVSGEEPVAAAFHAISSGKTESAADVWGREVSYLVPVDSPEDADNPEMYSEVTVSAEEAAGILGSLLNGLSLSGDPAGWIEVTGRTGSGMVKTVSVGGAETDGETIRAAFGLASANFSVSCADGQITFTVKGRGHGVGMSQCGAEAMAQAGSSWEEILARYYPGTEIAAVEA